jgi:hypothetical protein
MKTDPNTHRATIKKKIHATGKKATARHSEHKTCADCRAFHAFQAWHDQKLTPSFNWSIDFTNDVNIPAGKRAVIELVTATIIVPTGEKARLRFGTSLGMAPSNFDLTLTPQGTVAGEDILMATHTIRAYSDHDIGFDVNRDNAQTEGNATICISGYLVDA